MCVRGHTNKTSVLGGGEGSQKSKQREKAQLISYSDEDVGGQMPQMLSTLFMHGPLRYVAMTREVAVGKTAGEEEEERQGY